jgi:hypothetical protein
MCDVVWGVLAQVGIRPTHSSTWKKARPESLQHSKGEFAFRGIGSERTIGAIDEVVAGRHGKDQVIGVPSSCNSLPGVNAMCRAPAGNWMAIMRAGCCVPVGAMLTDVGPRCGVVNILSGSHRLVHKWFFEKPPPQGARGAHLRRSLERHPLHRPATTGEPSRGE